MKEYIVKSGDTLSKIAHNYKTDLNTLVQLNDIVDPNKIQVGQVIALPGNSYSEAITSAKKQLESGITWGTAWWNVKNTIPDADNARIDKDLNKDFWAKAGAYEKFAAKKQPDVKIVELPDTGEVKIIELPKPGEVEIIKLPKPGTVEIIEPKFKKPEVTIVPEKKPVTKPESIIPEKIITPEKDDRPLWAFLNKFISPDRVDKIFGKFKADDETAVEEVASSIRAIPAPETPYKKIEPTLKRAYDFFGHYKRGKIAIDESLLNQETRKAAKEREGYLTEHKSFFMVRGHKIDLKTIDPDTFYKDASGGILIPAKVAKEAVIKYDPVLARLQGKRAKEKIKLEADRQDFIDLAFSVAEENKWGVKELGIVLTGEEDRQQLNSILKEANDRLCGIIYESHNTKAIEIGDEINTNNMRSGKALIGMMSSLQNKIDGLIDFSFKDAPKDILAKANAGFFDLIKDVDLYNEYVKTAKDYNDYNDTLSTTIIDGEKAQKDMKKLEQELTVLKTEGNVEFLENGRVLDSLSSVERTAHTNYYWQNQKDIDRMYDIFKELSDIYSWIEINNIKAKNAENRSIVLEKSLENFKNDFVDLVATREFGNLISSYATAKNEDMSVLIGHYNEYSQSMAWSKKNENRIAEVATTLKTREAAALLEMQAITKKVNDFGRRYTNKMAKLYKLSKELELSEKLDTAAYNKEKSEVNEALNATRFLHPFKTWKLWKEHGFKEVLWEGFPKVLHAILEEGMKGLERTRISKITDYIIGNENIVKSLVWWSQMIQQKTLPHIAITTRNFADSIAEIAEYTGGAANCMAKKMTNVLFDKEAIDKFHLMDGKDVPARKFALWALSWVKDIDNMPVEFMDIKTKYDYQTAILPVDPGNEALTYSIYDIIEEYNSAELTKAAGLFFISKKELVEEIIKLNNFDKQGIDKNKIPAGTEVIISLENKIAGALLNNKNKQMAYVASEDAYSNFTTTKQCSLYDFVSRKDRDKITMIALLNDLPGQDINIEKIPVGTELVIPRYDQVPSFLSWMEPEKRLKFLVRHPYWNVVSNELAALIGDPVNLAYPIIGFRFGKVIDMAGGKASRELMKLARSKSPTGKISATTAKALGGMDKLNDLAARAKSQADWLLGVTEVLRLRPVSNPLVAKLPDNTPFLRLLKPEFGLDDQWNLSTLSVLMAKFRGITMSKMIPSIFKETIDITDLKSNAEITKSGIDVKNALFQISEKNKMVQEVVEEAMVLFMNNYVPDRNMIMKAANEYTRSYKTMEEWMMVKGVAQKNQNRVLSESILKDKESGMIKNEAELQYALKEPEEFYAEYYRRHKDIRVIDIAWELEERTGLTNDKLRKFFEVMPKAETMAIPIEEQFIAYQKRGKFNAIFHQERYTSLPTAGRKAFRELIQDPKTGQLIPNQKAFDAIKKELLDRYPQHKASLMRGIKAVEDYKAEIEWVRKYEEGLVNLPGAKASDRVLVPIKKNTQVELRTVDTSKLPKNLRASWGHKQFKVIPDEKTGKLVFIADLDKYKNTGLPYIMMDYGSVIPSKRLSMLYDTPFGKTNLSFKQKSVDTGKLIADFVDHDKMGRARGDKITYGDVLNTAFMDSKVGWFNKYFKDNSKGRAFRSDFNAIMLELVGKKKERKFVSKSSERRYTADRFELATNDPYAKRLYNVYHEIGKTAGYLNIEKFYGVVAKLSALYDCDIDHSTYHQLFDRLSVLKRQSGTPGGYAMDPTDDMLLLLMKIKGQYARPDFLEEFPLIKGLLTDKKYTSGEMIVIADKLKSAAKTMLRNKVNAKISARSHGKSPQEIGSIQSQIRTSIDYWNGKKLSSEEMAIKLKKELGIINKKLPEHNDKKFSTEELEHYAKLTEMDGHYLMGNIIPKFFTYIAKVKVGKETLLDNTVKFSKELNSKAIALLADVKDKDKKHILKIIDENTETIKKVQDNEIAILTRPMVDSRQYTDTINNICKHYTFNNDIQFRMVLSPDHEKLIGLRTKLIELIDEYSKMPVVKKPTAIEQIIKRTDFTKEQINSFIQRRKEFAKKFQRSEKEVQNSIQAATKDLEEAIAQGDLSENAAYTDAKERLVLLNKELNERMIPEDVNWDNVISVNGQLKFEKTDSLFVEPKIVTTKLTETDKMAQRISQAEQKIAKIETSPEHLPDPIHEVKIKPEQEITIEFQDGTRKTLKNNFPIEVSPHKLWRDAVKRHVGFDEEHSLYYHLIKFQEKLVEAKKTGKSYLTVGEEFPKGFMNDIAVKDLAHQLEHGFRQDHFADKKALDKLYRLEINVAKKEQAVAKILKKKETQPVKAKKELDKDISTLEKELAEAVIMGDRYANAIGVGRLNKYTDKMEIKRRYNKYKDFIYTKEYEHGAVVITRDMIDTLNQAKVGRVPVIDDYTDYGKGLIDFLKDHPHHYTEGKDYKIRHFKDAADNEISTADAIEAIRNSKTLKPLLATYINKDHGYGISENDLLELLSMSFKLKSFTPAEDALAKKSPYYLYERLFSIEEKKSLEAFANKLEKVYRKKGGLDADKERNRFWDDTATDKGEIGKVSAKGDMLEVEEMEHRRERGARKETALEDIEAEDYTILGREEILSTEEKYSKDIQKIIERAKRDEKFEATDYENEVYHTNQEDKIKLALSEAGLFNQMKDTLGWTDFAPAIGKDNLPIKGKWLIDSARTIDILDTVQHRMLQSTGGKYFDNGMILESVKKLHDEAKRYDVNTQEFLDLLPEIYGAKDAISYDDFKIIHKRTVEDAAKALRELQLKVVEEKIKYASSIKPEEKLLKKVIDVEFRLRQKYGFSTAIIRDALSKFDPDNRFGIKNADIYELKKILEDIDSLVESDHKKDIRKKETLLSSYKANRRQRYKYGNIVTLFSEETKRRIKIEEKKIMIALKKDERYDILFKNTAIKTLDGYIHFMHPMRPIKGSSSWPGISYEDWFKHKFPMPISDALQNNIILKLLSLDVQKLSTRWVTHKKHCDEKIKLIKAISNTEFKKRIETNINEALSKKKILEQKLKDLDLEKEKDKFILSLKNKEVLADSIISKIEFDIEMLKTNASMASTIGDILSETYKPKGKGLLEIKEFTKEFIDGINKRLGRIGNREKIVLSKLSKVKGMDSTSPLIRKYYIELNNLKKETAQLQNIVKVAIPWNIAVANKIGFTGKEIYLAGKQIFTSTYKDKAKELAKLITKTKDGLEAPVVLKAYKNLDLSFPTAKFKELSDDWFKEWFLNLDRKHPAEITMPKIDWKDLHGIDLTDSKIATERLTKFFESIEGQAVYPTIVDLTGKLGSFIAKNLPAQKNKIHIINSNIFKSELKSLIPGRAVFMSVGEDVALQELKRLFEHRQGVWLFGDNIHKISSKDLSEAFWSKALDKSEVAKVKIIWNKHTALTAKVMPPGDVTSLPHTLPRSIKSDSMKLIGVNEKDIITKDTIRRNLEHIYGLSNRFSTQIRISRRIQEEGISFNEVCKKMSKSLDAGGDVFVVGGYETVINNITREAIDDGINIGVKFYFAKIMTVAEKTIYDYIKENKGIIGTKSYDISGKFKIGGKGISDMVLFNNKDWFKSYTGKDYKILNRKNIAEEFYKKDKSPIYQDDRIIEFKSFKELDGEMTKEISDMIRTEWLQNENKLAPQFVKEDSKYKYNMEDVVSKWVLLRRRDKIKVDFGKRINENIKTYRNDRIEYTRKKYGRELYKWEHDLIENEIADVRNITRLVNDYVFKFEMPCRISNQIRTMVAEKMMYWSTLGIDEPDSSKFKTMFYKKLDDFILVTSLAKTLTHKELISRLKSFWIWNVLLLRPSWYLWNNLGDSIRGVFAVRDIKVMKDLQRGYVISTGKYMNKFLKEFRADAVARELETQVRNLLIKYNKEQIAKGIKTGFPINFELGKRNLKQLWRVTEKLNVPKEIKSSISKKLVRIGNFRKYRVFDIREEPRLPFCTESKKFDEILNFNFDASGKAITKAGEVIDKDRLEWITSSGLAQATTDPIYARRIIESMPENTWIERTLKRSRVFKGDLEMFAAQSEEIRRQIMAFDLLFKKGMTVAETEMRIKRWIFDYRDLTYAGRIFRTLFPFYTFHYKSLRLYFGLLLKAGPGAFQAGQALMEAIEQESAHLQDYLKDRIKFDFGGLKKYYWAPHCGIGDHFKMLLDPMQEFENMINNPLQAIGGLGFGPFPSSLIQEVTGEGYFNRTHTTEQLRELGWSMEEINDYKNKNKKESNADTDKFASWLITYSSALFPYIGFMQKMFATEAKNTLRNIVWHQSPKVRELFKLFGINIIMIEDHSLDEIAHVWHNMFSLPPAFNNTLRKNLEKENPELYKYFGDYTAKSWLKRIYAMDDDELKFKEGINKIEAVTVRKYYDMEGETPGSGKAWLARTPIAKDVLERYWATKGDLETYEAGLRKFEVGKMKSLVNEILSTLGTVNIDKIRKLDAVGIVHPFTKDLDSQKLYQDLYDMNGDLRIKSVEDLMAILGKHGVMRELAELMDESEKLDKSYAEYIKLTVKAKREQRFNDAKYYHIQAIIKKALPSNIDSMPDEEARKYWDKWKNLKETLIDSNPEYKKRYEDDMPQWKKEYLAKNEYYLSQWVWLRREKRKEGEDYFVEFYSMPAWFQKWYFIKNPIKALFYPIIADYTQQIKVIVEQRKKTGEWDAKKHYEALDYIWNKQNALKAWDKSRPGVYNYIDKHRQVWKDISEDETKDYFDLFYQNKGAKDWDDYREYYLSKPENEYKRITYPFIRTWTNLIEKDQKNDTSFSGTWFWSTNNEEARQLYGEHHPLEDGKNKLDYQQQWKDWKSILEEDRGEIYNLVLNAKPWFKNEYFRNHPERKIYYKLASEMQAIDDFNKSLAMFFNPKNKNIITAWEKDKPGTIANKEFWRDYTAIAEKDGRLAALDFYFNPKNKVQIDSHEKNNPGAHKAYSLWREYAKLLSDTWEGRKAKRQFLRSNPELKNWWNRGKEIINEKKEIIFKEEIYYTILDKVSAQGKGRQYYLDYFTAKAEAEKYLNDNPDLKKARELKFALLDVVDKTIQKLLDEYNQLAHQDERNDFLKMHKELDIFFLNTVPPGIKKIWLLQRSYFSITDKDVEKQKEKRRAFLGLYPELTEYWEISKLPSSYFTDRTKFEAYQTQFNKANDYFDAVKQGNWKLVDKLKDKLPAFPPDIRTEEGRWLLSKLYNQAMATWASTFGTYMSTYYFRSLPSWLRNEYYKRRPESKIISYTPMSRSLNNAVIIENSKHPDLTWARKMMKKYGRNMPASLDKRVQKIMVKWGEWESRSTWTSTQWSEWWSARSARVNRLRQKDLDEIPLLRIELARAQKMFSYSMLPIRGGRKHGVINPFLGASVLLPELTIGLENDILSNN